MKKALLANAGLKLSDSGGRTVVDKMYDLENNGDPTFTLSDRPEKHKTFDGVHEVCVEKEVTNLISAGQAQQADDSQSDWDFTRTTTLGYDTVFGKNVARHVHTTSNSQGPITQTADLELSGGDTTGRKITYSFVARNNGGVNNFNLLFFEKGGAEPGSFTRLPAFQMTDDFKEYSETYTIQQSDRTHIEVRIEHLTTVSGEQTWDIVAGLHMPIESAYPVLFTEGTRLAPVSVINDFLPDTGAVGWCGRTVRDDNNINFFYDTTGETTTRRTFIALNSNVFIVQAFGGSGGRVEVANPLTWANHTRKDIVTIKSWTTDTIWLWLCDMDGNLYGYSSAHQNNTTDTTDLTIGADGSGARHTSNRFSNLQSTTEVIDTAEKAKDYIEVLTKGNLNLKASEITHMNP